MPLPESEIVALPPRFSEVIDEIRAAIGRCESENVPADSILAAVMVELMPRLVGAYGEQRVARLLTYLAAHLGDVPLPPAAWRS